MTSSAVSECIADVKMNSNHQRYNRVAIDDDNNNNNNNNNNNTNTTNRHSILCIDVVISPARSVQRRRHVSGTPTQFPIMRRTSVSCRRVVLCHYEQLRMRMREDASTEQQFTTRTFYISYQWRIYNNAIGASHIDLRKAYIILPKAYITRYGKLQGKACDSFTWIMLQWVIYKKCFRFGFWMKLVYERWRRQFEFWVHELIIIFTIYSTARCDLSRLRRYLFIYLFIHSFIRSFVRSFVHSFIYLFIYLFIIKIVHNNTAYKINRNNIR